MSGCTVGIRKYSRKILISSLPNQGDDSGSSHDSSSDGFELSPFLLGKRTPNDIPITMMLWSRKKMFHQKETEYLHKCTYHKARKTSNEMRSFLFILAIFTNGNSN